jgi:B-cell receptor-associated protein 31
MTVEDLKHHPETETLYHMKLFRAQRNLYIAGFALFLQL